MREVRLSHDIGSQVHISHLFVGRRQRPSPAPVLPPEFDGVPTSVVMAVLPDLLRQYRQDEESAFNTYHPGLTRQDSGVTIATMATVGVDTGTSHCNEWMLGAILIIVDRL